uniref:Uncharacterized protein n=1 Tax=Zea mays TaxID=4577 RepID=C4J2F2_MAIZE|nr:unknown [Zea mays]
MHMLLHYCHRLDYTASHSHLFRKQKEPAFYQFLLH